MKITIIILSFFIFTNLAYSQEASSTCLVNISLFNESAKNKQYADAVTPWKAAYAECPAQSRAIYTRGREIIHWLLAQSKDEKTYQENFDLLMGMYDNRVKYFGADKRYPTSWILGLKGLDYISFAKNDALKKDAYGWLEASINGLNEKAELEVLKQFVFLSSDIYKAEPAHAAKFIADYLKVGEILDSRVKNPAEKKADLALQIKQNLDLLFVQSGAADCATLNNIYKDEVNAKKTDLEFLNTVLTFYRRVGCTDESVYFTAATSAHAIKPSVESANACAQMAYKKGEYTRAIEYYQEATRLETSNLEKSDYQYRIAHVLYNEMKNPTKARQSARQAIELNPKNGKAYLLIGVMYANTKDIFKDPILDRSVFWVAVDKFVKAKQVDASVAEDADKFINTYSVYFPSKEDIFFKKELSEGKPFTVNGWIGETTTARAAKQ